MGMKNFSKTNLHKIIYILLFLQLLQYQSTAQLNEIETNNMRLIYYGEASKYLVNYIGQCTENALKINSKIFHYNLDEKITVLMHDLNDFGNAGTGTVPHNHVVLTIAPLNYEFETSPANERINTTMNHELVHLVTLDQAANSDNFFRTIFGGKVEESADNPLTMLYGYLTVPRRGTPRWYKEGIAVFLETWMAGGIGRTMGGYDEMVFRTLVEENKPIYDLLGLESEGTTIDFQVGVNSYLYGNRFFSYLALIYGPQKLIDWTSRWKGSSAYFSSAFYNVYKISMEEAWNDWILWEKDFQEQNLAKIKSTGITEFRPITDRSLGSISRTFFDSENKTIYTAVNYPGQIAKIVSIDLKTGKLKNITDVKGSALYYVTSLAYNPKNKILFYTIDNNELRSLKSIDLKTGENKLLLYEERIGDISFNLADSSLWGIRHYNGISTLVRIPYPYNEWNQIYSFDYGKDLYNIDVSPNGKMLVGSLAQISGQQLLVKLNISDLIQNKLEIDTLFNFENNVPSNFIFSNDNECIYGTSYYSGVSNVYKYDLLKKDIEILTNYSTGFFRPMPISNDSLFVIKYTSEGFLPGIIGINPPKIVKAINFLGQEIVEKHPIVKTWMAPPPSIINIDSMKTNSGNYYPLKHFSLSSFYPIVEGYKNYIAYGFRFNFSDPIGFHNLFLSTSYIPNLGVKKSERFHAKLNYSYLEWNFESTYNKADFYDIFGPTKVSRKGYSIALKYKKNLLYDIPKRIDYTLNLRWFGNLQRLPDYQNISTSFDKLLNFNANYTNQELWTSLGGVDYEKGYKWEIANNNNYVNKKLFSQFYSTFDLGIPLFLNHSSIWFRSAAGISFGNKLNPFSNYYFGGFGNNWIDNQSEKQYRNYYSFPGVELNSISGHNFGKLLFEWNLPPLRFKNFGFPIFYVTWARTSVFSSGIITNIDDLNLQHKLINFGGQIDFKFIILSHLKTTLSFGYVFSFEKNMKRTNELMISLKIL